jgi:spore germination protein PC
MSDYLNEQGQGVLASMERQAQITLDDDHRKRVVDDVGKQLKERVHYYARTIPRPKDGSDDATESWSDSVKAKTVRDIQGAFANYLSQLKNKSPGR